MISLLVFNLLLFLMNGTEARFYRNLPLPRYSQRLIQIPLSEIELESLTPPSESRPEINNHLAALRPDYAILKVADVFKNFFEKRPSL